MEQSVGRIPMQRNSGHGVNMHLHRRNKGWEIFCSFMNVICGPDDVVSSNVWIGGDHCLGNEIVPHLMKHRSQDTPGPIPPFISKIIKQRCFADGLDIFSVSQGLHHGGNRSVYKRCCYRMLLLSHVICCYHVLLSFL
jgi:hypothetical protein